MLWFKSHPGLFWGRLEQLFWCRQVLLGRDLTQHILNRWLWCQRTSQLELLCLHCMRACWIPCCISNIIPTSLHTWTLKGHFPFKVCLPLDTLWSLFLCVVFCKSSYTGLVIEEFWTQNSTAFHVPNESPEGVIRKENGEKNCLFLDGKKKKTRSSCLKTTAGVLRSYNLYFPLARKAVLGL